MAITTVDDVILALATAYQALGRILATLNDRLDHTTNPDQRRGILLALPMMDSDQRAIQAKLLAVQANQGTFALPPADVLTSLDVATRDLSTRLAVALVTSDLVALATDLVTVCNRVKTPPA